jgi:hypothetical protein
LFAFVRLTATPENYSPADCHEANLFHILTASWFYNWALLQLKEKKKRLLNPYYAGDRIEMVRVF